MKLFLTMALLLAGCSSSPKNELVDTADTAPILHPEIDPKRVVYGNVEAPVTILEYGDFQCPACAVGAQSLKLALAKNPGKIRFIFKHLPLPYHPQARPAAQAFEVLRAKDPAQAYAFYETVYAEAGLLNSKTQFEKILKKFKLTPKSLAAEFAKLNLTKQFEEDKAEFIAFGFRGTPVFVVNGQAVTGAPSEQEFDQLIQKALKN